MVNPGFAPRDIPLFSIPDYVVFALMLAICTGIGIYYACAGGGQRTTRQFLLADRQMQILPVAMSLLASFMSAITVLGTPAETYVYGTMYFMFSISYLVMGMAAAHIYMPVFFNLGVTSAYEYLERRFSKGIRRVGSATFILQMVMYMGIVLYAPSLALEAVTGMNVWAAVLSLGIICTFYTTIGGMKAVLWTDTFQVCVMIAGFLAVIIQGCLQLGGISEVWEVNRQGGRLEFFNFDPDPRVRHSSWSVHIGGTFMWIAIFGVNQAQVQRYLTVSKLSRAQIALYLNVVGLWLIVTLATLCGLVLYAFYKDCDPIVAGYIRTSDQLMPLIVMEILSWLPGLPGLFVSCVFAGALSTMSSGLNSLSAVTLEDFVRSFKTDLTEAQYTMISKLLVAIYGGLMILMAYVSSFLGGILQAALSIFGMIGGPLLGLFTLGILFPWANVWGAYAGTAASFLLVFWVGIGAQVYKPPVNKPPISVMGCPRLNETISNVTMSTVTMVTDMFTTTEAGPVVDDRPDVAKYWYSMSYLYYSVIAVLTVLIVGLVVSFITGAQDPEELDPRLITPFFDTVCCCFPERWRAKLRCGVPQEDRELWMERDMKAEESEQGQELVELKPVGRDSQKPLLRRKTPWDDQPEDYYSKKDQDGRRSKDEEMKTFIKGEEDQEGEKPPASPNGNVPDERSSKSSVDFESSI
ncbi:sodium-coupled monocarboxylate transporter 1-like isoform X1 [Branchiostoma lanceolatum]|uniref:sodium-coupled monocarboxylate transporter 1-like isoform X1 n=1 Tax=Branchiostoma lanceolatum TaxID=7740 RepID=UPI00345202BF